MYQVKSLKTLCCNSFVENDNVEVLQPIVDMLPMDIVKYLLTIFDDFQFSRFHASYPAGATYKMVFIEKYIQLGKWGYYRSENCLKGNELKNWSLKYWTCRVVRTAMLSIKEVRIDYLTEVCTKVPHLLQCLHLWKIILNDSALELLGIFSNIRCVWIDGSVNFEKMFRLAKTWRQLRKIRLSYISNTPNIMPILKDFLEFKSSKNERVILNLGDVSFGKNNGNLIELLQLFGDSIQCLAGLHLRRCSHSFKHQPYLTTYSKVDRIKEVKLRSYRTVEACLLDIVKHAPAFTNVDNVMVKLRLQDVKLTLNSYTAFQHWRFSRLEYFLLSDVNIGHGGAALLAKHATFWPFVKRFVALNCGIPGSGFSLLLPAMVRDEGCENLVELDLRKNMCCAATFELIVKFLTSKCMTKLKILGMFGFNYPVCSFPRQFLPSLTQLFLVELDLTSVELNRKQVYEILYCVLSKTTYHLRRINAFVPTWDSDDIQQHDIDLNAIFEMYGFENVQTKVNDSAMRIHRHRQTIWIIIIKSTGRCF